MSSPRRKSEEDSRIRWAPLPGDPMGATWAASILTVTALEAVLWLEVERALIRSVIAPEKGADRTGRLEEISQEVEELGDSLRALVVLYGAGEC